MNSKNISLSKAIRFSASLVICLLLVTACGKKRSDTSLRNHYFNDLESYEGWQGISGYYYLVSEDAHSGQHSIKTDSTNIYSITFVKRLSDFGDRPVKKIAVSIWLKCPGIPANGSYVLSFEKANQIYKYFSFDLKEKQVIANEWMQVTGLAEVPVGLPKDVEVKIYFWNKGKSVILVDDFEFNIEN